MTELTSNQPGKVIEVDSRDIDNEDVKKAAIDGLIRTIIEHVSFRFRFISGSD
jgi:hypothetical protein